MVQTKLIQCRQIRQPRDILLNNGEGLTGVVKTDQLSVSAVVSHDVVPRKERILMHWADWRTLLCDAI